MPVVQIGLLHTGTQAVFGVLVNSTITAANNWLAANAPGTSVQLQPANAKYANDNLDQLEEDAVWLATANVGIILAAGGPQSALAAQDATGDTNLVKPVVFTTVTDLCGLDSASNSMCPEEQIW